MHLEQILVPIKLPSSLVHYFFILLLIDNIPRITDNTPTYLIAGIGKTKNHNPENIVIIDNNTTSHVGTKEHPLIIKQNGPESKIIKKIAETNIAKLAIRETRRYLHHNYLPTY